MKNINVDITCPSCKRKVRVALVKMKPGDKFECPVCKANIRFEGDDLSKVQKSLDDLFKKR